MKRRTGVILSAWSGALVAGVFCAIVAANLFTDWTRHGGYRSEVDLVAMKAQLVDDPGNETIPIAIRTVDLKRRQTMLRRLLFIERGRWMLWIGGVVLIASMTTALSVRRVRPAPPGAPHATRQQSWVNTTLLTTLLIASAGGTWLALAQTDSPDVARPPIAGTTDESLADALTFDWPRFRGANGLGVIAMAAILPDVDEATVAWESPIALPGKGSVIVAGHRAVVTGANARRREVYCYDVRDGKKLWTRSLPTLPTTPTDAPDLFDAEEYGTGYAAATGCTDGQRFYAIFANGDLVAVNRRGEIDWIRSLGLPQNQFGLGASLLLFDGKLVVPFDQTFASDARGNDIPQSKLLLIDPKTGKTIREIVRPVADSWTTPIVVESKVGSLLITAADPFVIAYNTAGDEVWRNECMSGDVAPSPVAAGGVVFVAMEGMGIVALDASTGKTRWENFDVDAPDIVSPLASETHVWLLTTSGHLQCLSAKDGSLVWAHEYEDRMFLASPTLLGTELDQVLLIDRDGSCDLISAGDEYELLEEAMLDDAVFTTPAIGEGMMLLRGTEKLIRISQK